MKIRFLILSDWDWIRPFLKSGIGSIDRHILAHTELERGLACRIESLLRHVDSIFVLFGGFFVAFLGGIFLQRDRGWRTFKRPGVDAFLEHMAQFYEIVVYSDQLPMVIPNFPSLKRASTSFLYFIISDSFCFNGAVC